VPTAASVFRSVNNLFIGNGTLYPGKQPQASNNLQAAASVLVNATGFDYHLKAGVAAINTGIDPGSAGGVSLLPTFQYLMSAKREGRGAAGMIDVGAFEFVP
jgi:hypothetical protein